MCLLCEFRQLCTELEGARGWCMASCLKEGVQCRGVAQVSTRKGRSAIYWPGCPQVLTATALHVFLSDSVKR